MAKIEEIKVRHGIFGSKALDVFGEVSKMIKFRVKLWVFPLVVVSGSSRALRLHIAGLIAIVCGSFVRIIEN